MENKKIVSVRLSYNDIARLQETAQRHGTTVSLLISLSVSDMLNRLYDDEGFLRDKEQQFIIQSIDRLEGYYPSPQLAERFKVSPDCLRRSLWRNKRKIRVITQSGKSYVKLKDVLKLYGKNKPE